MGKVGRKISHAFHKVGTKLVHKRMKIGAKLAKAGRITSRIAPFLSAVPLVGPELSMGAAALGGAAQAGGGLIRARNIKQASRGAMSLAETYNAAKSARH